MPAIILLLSMLAQSQTLEAQSNGIVFSPYYKSGSLSIGNVDEQPVCKVADANEYEPCAWQDERAAEREKTERLDREDRLAKAKCVAGGCLVVRQVSNFVYTTNPPTYPPDWRCDCKAKQRATTKKVGK